MKTKFITTVLLAAALVLSGCSAGETTPEIQSEPEMPMLTEAPSTAPTVPETTQAPETEPTLSPAEEILQDMTLREKVGQLFIVRPDALDLTPEEDQKITALTPEMEETLVNYPVGGFAQFGKNIVDPDQILHFNFALSEACPIAPFLAVDEEGGLVARLARKDTFDLPKYESAGAVGAEGPEAALQMGRTIGAYVKQYGFNMDFAPVADTFTNPQNTVIGTRAFSTDPQIAASCARAMADGLIENHIMPVFKHFPGHGDTVEDSHEKLPIVHKTVEELMSCEWIPFMEAGAGDCMMSAHIALPEVSGNMIPATLNPAIIQNCLREKLGYEGLVITDAMEMDAIEAAYSSGEAALMALKAGCDIVLMPPSLTEAFDAVVSAAEDGSFPMEELDARVLKILNVKLQHKIILPQ